MDKSEFSSPERSITLPADDFSVEDEELLERLYAALYGDAALSRAENTLRAYRADWNHFAAWCVQHQLESLPAKPATVVLYLSEAANTFKLSTIARRIASINEAHRSKDYELPIQHCDVHRMWNEIKRNKWEEPVTRKRPVLTQDIKDMLKALPSTRSGIRDRALLLLGLAGSMRCSDLARIDLGDLTFTTKGLAVTIPHSKTDLDGKKLHIPYATSPEICPVRAVRAWLEAAAIVEGPLFRAVSRGDHIASKHLNPASVGRIVKRALLRAGRNDVKEYSASSLRVGLATQAALSEAQKQELQQQSEYLFRDNAAGKLGI